MTWDPTDKQGWKRALEISSLESAPARPAKKVRFDMTSNTEELMPFNVDVDLDKNIDITQAKPGQDIAAMCEPPTAEPGPTRSFFRVKKQHPLPAPIPVATQNDFNNIESSGQRTAFYPRGNGQLYDILQSPYSQVNSSFHEPSASSGSSTSTSRTQFNRYVGTAHSSSSEVDNVTTNFMTPASISFTKLDLFAPTTVAPSITRLEGTPKASAFAKAHSLFRQASTPALDHQGFLFGNGGDDLDRGYKSDYFDKIKNNPYTTALLPREPEPGVLVPQSATEARDLFKRGRYGQPKQDTTAQPTVDELQKVLRDLCKRFAKLKVMCDTAGIDVVADVWDRTVAIVEGDRPDIKQALDGDTGKGLAAYTEQVERWDKAVGHQAILMKRLNYKQQIVTLEKKIKEAKIAAAESIRDGDWEERRGESDKEDGNEWKGHRTGFGRRFSGLIEKN